MTVAPRPGVKSCPSCGREIAEAASVCETCEAWAASLVEARPATAAPEPVAAGSRRQLTYIAAGVAVVAVMGLAMSARGGAPADAPGVATAPAPHATPAPASPPVVTAVQRWNTENQAAWLDRRRGAAFELLSENIVKTWFGPTRPTLVIRCAAQNVEAFVVTGSLKIDPRVEGKTMTVSVDGEPGRTEQWTDSEDHTAVFAPDAAAFTQRLRTARTLQLGYSPHNSSDVVAQFNVAGFDALFIAASKHCGASPRP